MAMDELMDELTNQNTAEKSDEGSSGEETQPIPVTDVADVADVSELTLDADVADVSEPTLDADVADVSEPTLDADVADAADVAETILEVRGVTKAFDGHKVLENLNLTLRRGKIISLLGISGSGKSTLFNIIAGLLMPDAGQVFLGGTEITGETGHVAYMLQKDLLLPHLTVLDNVALPLRIRGQSRPSARAQALPLIPKFGLSGYENLYPAQLSGGMAQRAAFLRTYLFSSEVALLDEPFSRLDQITKEQLQIWYLSMMDQLDLSTIFITHDIDEALRLSDRIAILLPETLTIGEIITIAPEHRRQADFNLKPEFLAYKKRILSVLGV